MQHSRIKVAITASAAVALAGCSTQTPSTPTTTDGVVLADGYQLGGYNPVAGHGATGDSKIYEGLLAVPGGTTLGDPEPRLAAAPPTPNADATAWTVPLRDGVTFSDGSAFDAADVVATYTAVIDPASASPLVSDYDMLTGVVALDDTTVRFDMAYSYAQWPAKLLLGIAPSEALSEPGTAADSPLNSSPIGTGPYVLTDLRPDQAVFTARDDYWGGRPEVEQLTVVYVPDDNTRAQRLAAGEVDGANLPPLLARTFTDRDGYTVVGHPSADWRGVSLPAGHPVTGDIAIRRALNLAVDRDAMIDNILAGYGSAAHTPVSDIYADTFVPDARYDFDPSRAEALLDESGWTRGPDGVRARDGRRAEFTVMYFPEDTLRRDLAAAFASDAARIGIDVAVEAADRAVVPNRLGTTGMLLGGGDNPYSLDTQLYSTLHGMFAQPGVGGPYANASDFSDPRVDEILDTARRTGDTQARAAAYRGLQTTFVDASPYVMLAFLDHTYVMRDGGWSGTEPVVEPHSHGVNWGPWWNLHEWTRR